MGPCSQPYVREEEVSRQVAAYFRHIAVSPIVADEMIGELETERQEYTADRKDMISSIRGKIQGVNDRIGRLTAAYTAEALSREEFRIAKNECAIERRGFEDQLITLERKRSSWLEPAIKFVNDTKQGVFLTENGSETQRLDFLRKVGSNLKIADREIQVTPRGAWKLVVDSGRIAQTTAAEISAAAFLGKSILNHNKLGN